jgi:small subunit ribosomal protein S2
MPYVVERWLGGMLTNYRTIKEQVEHLKRLEAKRDSGELAKDYNKREVGEFEEEIKRLNRVFGGIKHMDGLPKAMFVVDAPRERIAIMEAVKLGIPVVGIADSNADPELLDYPIPANDDAVKSIRLITGVVAQAARQGYEQHLKTAPPEEPADA